MKKANTYKGKLGWQSEFSHRYACWANNHNGWAKAKKSNKRLAKRRLNNDGEIDHKQLDELTQFLASIPMNYWSAPKMAEILMRNGWIKDD